MNKWIKWNGGDCPVHPETIVEVMFSDLTIFDNERSGDLNWHHIDHCGDIVAYRVVRARNRGGSV